MEILLQNGMHTIIDDEDYEKISQYHWYAKTNKNGRVDVACSFYNKNCKQKTLRLHRVILSAPDKILVDHINGNTLDNRKCNLRLCNNSQNCKNRKSITKNKNSSKYKGVFRWRNKWKAQIRTDDGLKFLGCYLIEEDAAHAYNIASIQYHKEFSALNILPEWYDITSLPVRETKRKIGQHKNVYFDDRRNKWYAVININKKRKRTKYCNSEEDALILRNELMQEVLNSLAIEKETGMKGVKG